MIFLDKKTETLKSSSADVVEGHLVLSLLNAQDPKIWRMALDKIGTASFEIDSGKETQETKLILKPKKGTAEIIATFETKEQAVEALSQASDALRGETSAPRKKKIPTPTKKPANAPMMPIPPAEKSKWGVILLGIVVVIGLYYYMQTLIPQESSFDTTTSAAQTNTPPQQKTGIPVPFDEYYNEQ